MSRWIDSFENHNFRSIWDQLKTALAEERVDDETVITSVKELARLKKVISYLDEMLKTVDPELVPSGTWDSFDAQATACLQQINQYTSNRNIGHIQNANAHADNLLTYLRPYMIPSERVGEVLQQAIKSYAQTVNEYSESFRNRSSVLVGEISSYAKQSKKICEAIEKTESQVEQFNLKLFGGDQPEAGIQNKVNELVEELDKKYTSINDFYNETLVGDSKTPSTMMEISNAKVSILTEQKKIKELLDDVSTAIEELNEFHIKIFGKPSDEEEGKGGLFGELNERVQALSEFESKQITKYKALNDQIENLLPGATSAGLASAYLDMKLSFDAPIRTASNVFFWSIAVLVIASTFLAIDNVGWFYINFVKFNDWNTVLKGLVYKIPFYAPILWLAFYASKRRSEYQRLQQEYAHKEALAKSYDSYKKQIESLDGEDMTMQKAFIMKAIDAIAYNASNTLDGNHGDKMPALDMIEKVIADLAKIKEIFK
jgi:hypothetical protein